MIRLVLKYASLLWHPTLTKSQTERLEAVEHMAINIIFLLLFYPLSFYFGAGWHFISSSKKHGSPQVFSRNIC